MKRLMLVLLAIAAFVAVCLFPPAGRAWTPSPAFYVAVNGSNNNPGTLAAPFATIAQAQAAMRASGSVKLTYIRAGSYKLPTITNCDGTRTCGVRMSAFDNGETLSYYPPDGVGSVSLNAGSTASGNGLWEAFNLAGSSNVTINGLTVHNFQAMAFASTGGTHTLTLKNNIMYNGFYVETTTGPQDIAAISCYGCSNTVVSNNVVHDIASNGIDFGNINGNISNLIVSNNVIYNTCTAVLDCGGLYLSDPKSTAVNISMINNQVHDGNSAAIGLSGWGSGIYLDACASNVLVKGNVIDGKAGSNTFMIHGGSNNRFIGNLVDLSGFKASAMFYQTNNCTGGMARNQYTGNILISSGSGGGYRRSGSPPTAPTIANNNYWAYAGGAISAGGSYSDAHPTGQNPQISGWSYIIAADSPAFGSPVNFPPLVEGWGPLGYAIPHAGTPPSNPH